MSGTNPSAPTPPLLGTAWNDVLSVDTSVTFAWVPDPGDSFTEGHLIFDDQLLDFRMAYTSEPSHATGTVTFDSPSSKPLAGASASDFSFLFTRDAAADQALIGGGQWAWNPATGVLDPTGSGAAWDDVIQVAFDANTANFSAFHFPDGNTAVDHGHWALVPNPIDIEVDGGAGNDTIYGGQGTETLSGGSGNDLIDAGAGADTVLGGTGNDTLHGGIGDQILDGGDGNDVLHAGAGTETLTGGTGRDTFVFGPQAPASPLGCHAVIVDFQLGLDTLQIARNLGGLPIARPHDLAAHVTATPGGAATLTLGTTSITLLGLTPAELTAALPQIARIA